MIHLYQKIFGIVAALTALAGCGSSVSDISGINRTQVRIAENPQPEDRYLNWDGEDKDVFHYGEGSRRFFQSRSHVFIGISMNKLVPDIRYKVLNNLSGSYVAYLSASSFNLTQETYDDLFLTGSVLPFKLNLTGKLSYGINELTLVSEEEIHTEYSSLAISLKDFDILDNTNFLSFAENSSRPENFEGWSAFLGGQGGKVTQDDGRVVELKVNALNMLQ